MQQKLQQLQLELQLKFWNCNFWTNVEKCLILGFEKKIKRQLQFLGVWCLLAGSFKDCNTYIVIYTFPWYASQRSKNGGRKWYWYAGCCSAVSICSTIIYIHSCKHSQLQLLQLLNTELQLALKWGQKRIIRVFRFLELQLIATKLQFIGEKLQLNCNFSLTLNLTFLKLHLFSYLQYLL